MKKKKKYLPYFRLYQPKHRVPEVYLYRSSGTTNQMLLNQTKTKSSPHGF